MTNPNYSSHFPLDGVNYGVRKHPQVVDDALGMERRTDQTVGSERYLAFHQLACRPPTRSIYDLDHPSHEAAHFPGPVGHTFYDKPRSLPSQEYSSHITPPVDFTISTQRPTTMDFPQSFYVGSIGAVSNVPSSSPSSSPEAYHWSRPLPSLGANFINSTTHPDEVQFRRCYTKIPGSNSILTPLNSATATTICDEASSEYDSRMQHSERGLDDTWMATTTASADSPAVQRTSVAPPAVVVAAALRRTPGRATPHVCRLCYARFTAGHNLKNHIHSHMGVRPYSCKGCQRAFVTKHDCRRHEKTCKDTQQA